MSTLLCASDRERLQDMTGHTDDLGEAIDQWENERQGLVELYELTKRQDKLLQTLRQQWDTVRLALWGKDDEPDAQHPRLLTPTTQEKVIRAIHALDDWNVGAAGCQQDAQQALTQWHQLTLSLNTYAKEAQDATAS